MPKAKVTSKGQITIPHYVRERLGLRPGDEVEFVEERGVYRLHRVVPDDYLKEWVGFLKKELGGRSSDEIVREMRGD
jgi:AbrB family looped-hinge helix DNA binding protein